MTAKEQGLPELPEAAYLTVLGNEGYTADQMRAYALAALASDTGERGVAVRDSGGPPFYAAIVETEADEYWDDELPEEPHFSINDVVVSAVESGCVHHGDHIDIGRAKTMPMLKVRVLIDGDDCSYELVSIKHDGQWHGINRTMPAYAALRAQPAGGGDIPQWALPAVESALAMLDEQGYAHTDLAAFRDWLKESTP